MTEKKKNKFICFIAGSKYADIDRAQCFIANFTFILYDNYFGHICMALLIPIILISIFGGIKEHYRWFILNQACWDLIISFDYIRDYEAYQYFRDGWYEEISGTNVLYFQNFIKNIIDTNPYCSLLLLSFNRFLCLYFADFYEKLTKNRRIFCLIFIYNFIIIFLHIDNGFGQLALNREINLEEICEANLEIQNSTNFDLCYQYLPNDFIYHCLTELEIIFRFIVHLKPFICLSISIIAAMMIMGRILKHTKFQTQQHNRKDFINSLRIFIVILLQTFINTLFFFVELNRSIDEMLFDIFGINVSRSPYSDSCEDFMSGEDGHCIEINLPLWLGDSIGLTDQMIFPAIRQLRIFMESIVVLSILTGYREAIINFVKFSFKFLRYPRKECERFKLYLNRRSSIVTTY